MEITIRKEQVKDFDTVYEINTNAFETNEEAELVNKLRQGDAFIPDLSLVAESNNEIIGHILFTKITIESPSGDEFNSLALAPMAVKNSMQNQGIGSKLVEYGLDKAAALGFVSVIVLGHEKYYPKFGFIPASNFEVRAPFDVPETAFMAIELKVDSLKKPNGIVKYAKEFGI